jgi:hypothetical protein
MPHDAESFQDGREQGWRDNAAQRETDAKVIAALREALEEISQPILAMQKRAAAQGYDFNGETALNIASNPEHYKLIARNALAVNEQTVVRKDEKR